MGKKQPEVTDGAPAKPKKKKLGFIFMLCFLIIVGSLFFPTSIVLVAGMLPTFTANINNRGGRRIKALTVGAMNFAGCVPFLLELWASDYSIQHALNIIKNPRTIVVIWSAASVGYLINWAMASVVNTIMVQRANMQLKDLKKRQLELVERWGPEVRGDMPLDGDGFPMETKPAGTR